MASDYTFYTDKELIDFLRNNDEKAFITLYERHWKALYNTAYKRIKDHELCQDIIQEIFADIWVRKNELQVVNVAGYLHNAVRFQVLKTIGKVSRSHPVMDLWHQLSNQTFSADSRIQEKEFNQLVEAYLRLLSEGQRKAFRMRFLEDMSSAEIATALKISPKTVRNQSAKAVQVAMIRFSHLLRWIGIYFIS